MSVHHKEITDQNLIRIADAMRTRNPCSDNWFGMTEIDYIYI